MLKLKRINGVYYALDNKYAIMKEMGFWVAFELWTGQSVVDCENTLRAIRESLEGYIRSTERKEG